MKISGIILCGGKSSRMNFKNKCFLKLGEKKFIEIIIEKMKKFFLEIILVTRNKEIYLPLGERVVTDIYCEQSSLSGIHAGLFYSKTKFNFVIGCDTPLIKEDVIKLISSEASENFPIILPKIRGYFEPLCGIYSTECIPVIEKMLEKKDYKISNLFSQLRVKTVSEDIIRKADPDLVSFLNVNSPRDYEDILKIYFNLF